jgi:hypothetical protein
MRGPGLCLWIEHPDGRPTASALPFHELGRQNQHAIYVTNPFDATVIWSG